MSKTKTWSHNGFQPTNVPCLYRRDGRRGIMHYGRVKRNGKLYMQKLASGFDDAKRALRAWLTGVEAKAAAAAVEEGPALHTWGDFKDRYMRTVDLDVALAPRSKQYRHECVTRILNTWRGLFTEEIEDRKIAGITQEQVMLWAASITGYYTGTYNNTVATMKHVFEEAVDAGHLLSNPAKKLKRICKLPRVHGGVLGEPGESLTAQEERALETPDDEGKRWYPTPEELQLIVAKMRSYKFGPCQAAAEFAELLFETGCRLTEANRLRWSDVDWKENKLRINGSKGRATSSASSIRFLPISTGLASLLRRLGEREHLDIDKIARVRECRGTMQRACVELNLPRKIHHHDLRHSFATRAVNCGVPVPVVADWLGHKDGGVLLLRIYRHEDPAVSQAWIKKI